MSYSKFANIYQPSTGEAANPTSFYNAELGIQAEIEDRIEASFTNGVISGCLASISTTSIAIASGEAYCEGKRYSGASSVSFVGESADTYYVYVDPTDNTTPYKVKTTVPTTAQLTLCKVTWNGTDTLSALVDLREWGTVEMPFEFHQHNTVTAGLVQHQIAPVDFWIADVKESCGTAPTGSSVIVNVKIGDAGGTLTSIFTTTSYRPTYLTSSGVFGVVTNTGYPEYGRKVTAGQVIAVYVDQTDSNNVAQNLTVLVRGRMYGRSA